MLDALLNSLLPKLFGKSVPSILEEMTGVSAKTWRKEGGPKRAGTHEQADARMRDWMLKKLQDDGGFTEEEALKIREKRLAQRSPSSHLAWLPQVFDQQGKYEWPITEALAKEIDAVAAQLHTLRQDGDFAAFQKVVLCEFESGQSVQWTQSLPMFRAAREEAINATAWLDLAKLTALWVEMSIFQFLSCWDVEFLSVYLTNKDTRQGMQPQPMFLLLAPMLNPRVQANKDKQYPSRGLFHLPLRRLLVLCFCLAHMHRNHTWPNKKMVGRTHIAAWGGKVLQGEELTEQPIAKIYKGSRGITAVELIDIWVSMCGEDADGISPTPPWPCYVAAQVWTCLLIERDLTQKDSGATSLTTLDADAYRYWWNHYYQESEAKETFFGNLPWPHYLRTI